jgi:hypothetical protein
MPNKKNFEVGTRLNNGAVVADTAINSRNDRYVVAYWSMCDQFVTWAVDNEGNAYWGHYFERLTDACNDLQNRVAG